MLKLARTVRFSIPLDPAEAADQGHNTFAGWPAVRGLGAWYELTVTCGGEPDRQTGYLLNIAEIDRAVRHRALPLIVATVRETPGAPPALVLPRLIDSLQGDLKGSVRSVRWHLTPYYSLTMTADASTRVLYRQSFEFAAAHRLHCAGLSDAENRALFGKCNNPAGHGHNYRIEVAVAVTIDSAANDPDADRRLDNLDIEKIVHDRIVTRFDHKNLDLDIDDFKGMNSSVENIARVSYELLKSPIESAGGELRDVTVWETEKTCCTYPARD